MRDDYKLIASGGFNQARRQIRKTLRQERAQKFCDDVAKDVATDRRYEDIRDVQIVTGRFRVDDYFAGNKGARGGRAARLGDRKTG